MSTTPRQGDLIEVIVDGENYLSREVIEQEFNPEHQGFIGFIPPTDAEGHDVTIQKTARRIAAELVLMPEDRRGGAYDDEYLKKASGCRSWPRLRCAHCDCWKNQEETE